MYALGCLLVLLVVVDARIFTNAANNNIVIYWGQDSGGGTGNLEKRLSYYCGLRNYNVINLSFMISFIDQRQPNCQVPNAPDLNFANHENNCTTFPNCPFLLNCPYIGDDITACQAAGKKIVLSLGGAAGSYGFTSDAQAVQFATTVWNMFFEGNGPLRPFGRAVLDGIDLDIEGGSTTGYSAFVKSLRSKMAGSRREYIISGAPQCPYPDAYLGPAAGRALGDSGSSFSYVSVQFYNNYCGATSPTYFWQTFEQWHSSATKDGYKVMVGLPAASGAGGGYISVSAACALVQRLKSYSNFGGFMFWDASWDMNNNFYTTGIRQCLG